MRIGWTAKACAVFWVLGLSAVGAVGARCLVCGGETGRVASNVVYRGTAYAVHDGGCREKWEVAKRDGDLDRIVFDVEPRSALFQGDSRYLNSDAAATSPPLGRLWLGAGLWLLAALASGGAAAGLAVVTHRGALAAFALGAALPGIGIPACLAFSRRTGEFGVRGTKVPRTHEVATCPGCGRSVHPSAQRCSGCGGDLTSSAKSEVSKTGVHDGR